MSVKKILTVSDTPIMQRFLEYNLTQRGYHVSVAPNNKGVLQNTIQEEIPDMVILDVLMPTFEGIDLCLFIRQQYDVPILVLSACGPSSSKFRGLDLQKNDHLTEPFGILDLVQRIDNILGSNS